MDLGVHRVIGGGPMPPYIPRPHDELLGAVLDPSVAASRLVVVRGGSSTGKTRAAYEAVAARLAGWQLDYPLNAAALAARLEAGISAHTVLWLGELRQYADDAEGASVLGRIADLLADEGHLAITTIWPEQWAAYTAAARAGHGPADPVVVAGRLLKRLPELTSVNPAVIDPARGAVIDVPSEFTSDDLDAAACTGDPVLAAAAGQEGQVAQYLAGDARPAGSLCWGRRRHSKIAVTMEISPRSPRRPPAPRCASSVSGWAARGRCCTSVLHGAKNGQLQDHNRPSTWVGDTGIEPVTSSV